MRPAWSLVAICGACMAHPWPFCCYEGFVESVDALAGPSAIDCGSLNSGQKSGDAQRRQAAKCVRDALTRERPFKFLVGLDDSHLQVLVRSRQGELWIASYWQERSRVDIAEHASNKVCKSVSFDEETLGFQGQDCIDSSEFTLPTYVPHPGH